MHIIIDCTTTQNQLDFHGIGKYTKHIVKGLINKGIDITLLMYEGSSTIDEYIKKDNVEIYRLGPIVKSDYRNIIRYHTQILPAIKKVRREDSIYFCPYFWIGIPSRHIPTVLMIHDMILPIFNIYSEKGFLQNIIKKGMYWLELYKARYAKAIITNSKQTAKDFSKYFPKYPKENIYPIYLDIETDVSNNTSGWDSKLPKDYKERGYFIYLGSTLAKSKNSDGVIKGYREFLVKSKNDRNAPYLVIAGKGFTKDENPSVIKFKDKIECLGLKENVIFIGFYEDNHIKPLLKNSISSIHLSLYEGFGIALVEAMRYETPIIAHNGSCNPEVLKDAGILVDGLNPKEVGNAMYGVYTDERYREDIIERGKERAKVFDWGITIEKTVKVFEKVAKEL